MKQKKLRCKQKESFRSSALSFLLLFAMLFTTACSDLFYKGKKEQSCNFIQNKFKERVSWGKNLPIRFRVHKDLPEEARSSILEAASQWNLIATRNVIEISSWEADGSPKSSHGDRVPKIFWLKSWEEGREEEQARTTILWTKNVIKDADIRINAKDFDYNYKDEAFSYTKVDLVSLLVHEFGHALGLAHTKSTKSVMFPTLARNFDRRSIEGYTDLDSLSCEYGEDIVKPAVLLAALELENESKLPIGGSGTEDVGGGSEPTSPPSEQLGSEQGTSADSGVSEQASQIYKSRNWGHHHSEDHHGHSHHSVSFGDNANGQKEWSSYTPFKFKKI